MLSFILGALAWGAVIAASIYLEECAIQYRRRRQTLSESVGTKLKPEKRKARNELPDPT